MLVSVLLKREHLIGACLQLQSFNTLSSWWQAWWHTGRHGAREVAENSTFRSESGSKKRETQNLAWALEMSKLDPVSHFLQQGHTSSSFQRAELSIDQASIQIYKSMEASLTQTITITDRKNICQKGISWLIQ